MQPRRFVDEAGWTWQVIEVAAHAAGEAGKKATKAALYFMSTRNGTRRLDRQAAGDWESLSAQELSALRDLAVLV